MMKHAAFKNFVKVFKCPICRDPIKLGEEGKDGVFCSVCRTKWEIEKGKLCPDCGLAADLCHCLPELMKKAKVESLLKLCFYDSESGSAADKLVLYLKDFRDKRVFDFAASELSALLSKYFAQNNIDPRSVIFTFAPRSRSTVESRGFDQAKILSKTAAVGFHAKFRSTLQRSFFSRRQKGLDSTARLKNSKNAFHPKRSLRLGGATVVLIDDVVTTGASLAVCADILRKAGAERVICAAIARTDSKSK